MHLAWSCEWEPQTSKHVLSDCSSLIALHRNTERHNKVLSLLINWLKAVVAANQTIYADLSEANIYQSQIYLITIALPLQLLIVILFVL